MIDQPDVQAPSLNRRKVGDYVVTYLSDGFLDGSWPCQNSFAAKVRSSRGLVERCRTLITHCGTQLACQAALMAATNSCRPMMFMTRVRL